MLWQNSIENAQKIPLASVCPSATKWNSRNSQRSSAHRRTMWREHSQVKASNHSSMASDRYRRYRHLYESKPYNVRLAEFAFSNIKDLRNVCHERVHIPGTECFDDIFADAICLFVTSDTPHTAPREVIIEAFIRCFRNLCITVAIHDTAMREQRLDEGRCSDLDLLNE